MKKIDLNCDLGESFGSYQLGNDKEVLKYISSANLACGFHAGDPLVICQTIELALDAGVSIGAHPGFPDLNGFGRRAMQLSEKELYSCVFYQVSALKSMVEAYGGKLHHVKPHGAMYNMAAADVQMALTIAKAIQKVDERLILVGLANSQMLEAAREIDLPYASEAFADRRYTNKGMLMPRSQANAVITDAEESINQVIDLLEKGQVKSGSDVLVPLQADTICLHGDNAHALEFAKQLNMRLNQEGYTISPLKTATP